MNQRTQSLPHADLKTLACTTEPPLSELDQGLQMPGAASFTIASTSSNQESERLGEYASQAMKKALHKMLRHQKAVLKDTDIEELHQMRIGLRRLRTTIVTFEHVLSLPDMVRDVTLKPLAKRLGRVRDFDVLLLTLRDRHRPHLPKKERKVLDRLLKKLQAKRDRQFKRMKQFLLSDTYQAITEGIGHWCQQMNTLQAPNSAAVWPIHVVLPDLLLPVLSQTLLHPGWLVVPDGLSFLSIENSSEAEAIALVNQWLDQEGLILHDLRKQMKQLRYQTDFFASHYDTAYRQQIKDFKTIQDILGTLQDTWVLADMLQQLEGPLWSQHLPSMHQQIQHDRWQTWQQWEQIRQTYMTVEMRSHLRQMMLIPRQSQASPSIEK